LGGAAFATALVVHTVEESTTLRRIPHLLLSWAVAMWILAAAIGFQAGIHLSDLPLLVLNGLLVSATSIGARHAALPKKKG